jgi:hypothetical protein
MSEKSSEAKFEKIRELTTKYQSTNYDPKIFEEILAAVDKLLINQIYKYESKWYYFKNVDKQDAYQTAVCALNDAMKIIKPWDNGHRIIAKIISYIKWRFKQTFYKFSKLKSLEDIGMWESLDVMCTDDNEITKGIIFEEFFSGVNDLINQKKLKGIDVYIMIRYLAYEETLTSIAKELGIKIHRASHRYRRAVRIIRENMNAEDFILEK